MVLQKKSDNNTSWETKFRENLLIFASFSLFAKMEKTVFVSTLSQVNEMLGRELESKKVSGLAGKAVAEGVCRMLGKDYKVDGQKSLAMAMVIMCDAKLLTDTQRMKQLGLKALTDNQMATLKVCEATFFCI
jgi:hypothetical protein